MRYGEPETGENQQDATDATAGKTPSETIPWRALLRASLHRNRSSAASRYLQLATLGIAGFPKVRTVVFRGFDDPTAKLLVVCDRRSKKVEELVAAPRFALAWYFEKTREQYRMEGSAEVFTSDRDHPRRKALWEAMSPAVRESFSWPAPGEKKNLSAESALDSPNGLGNFAVLLLTVESVDYLDLRPSPHQRRSFVPTESGWIATELNP